MAIENGVATIKMSDSALRFEENRTGSKIIGTRVKEVVVAGDKTPKDAPSVQNSSGKVIPLGVDHGWAWVICAGYLQN